MIHGGMRRCATHRRLSLSSLPKEAAPKVADEPALSTFIAMVVSIGQVVVVIIGHCCSGSGLCANFSAGPAV